MTPPWGAKLLSWERNRTHGNEVWHEDYVLFPDEARKPDRRDSMWHWRRVVYPGHYPPGAVAHEKSLIV